MTGSKSLNLGLTALSAENQNAPPRCLMWALSRPGKKNMNEPKTEAINYTRQPGLAPATCSGAVVESEDNTVICERCNGNGWTVGRNEYEWETFQEQCETCYGTGRIEKAKPQPNVES